MVSPPETVRMGEYIWLFAAPVNDERGSRPRRADTYQAFSTEAYILTEETPICSLRRAGKVYPTLMFCKFRKLAVVRNLSEYERWLLSPPLRRGIPDEMF